MDIARPIDGFKVTWPQTISSYVQSEIDKNPLFERFWGDLIEHLKFVAHRVGGEEPRLGKGCRIFATGPDRISGQPRIVVGYRALGENVTIRLLRVSY